MSEEDRGVRCSVLGVGSWWFATTEAASLPDHCSLDSNMELTEENRTRLKSSKNIYKNLDILTKTIQEFLFTILTMKI